MAVPPGRAGRSRADREPPVDPPAHLRPEGADHPVRETDRGQDGTRERPAPAATREPARHRDRGKGRVERRPDRERARDRETERPPPAATRPRRESIAEHQTFDGRLGPHPSPALPPSDDHLDRVEVDEERVRERVVGAVWLAVERSGRRLAGDRETGVVDDEPSRDRFEAARPHRRQQSPELLDDEERIPAPHQHEVPVEAPLPNRTGHADIRLPPVRGPKLLEGRKGGQELDRGRGVPRNVRPVADERRVLRHVLHPDAERVRGQAVAFESLLHRLGQSARRRGPRQQREEGGGARRKQAARPPQETRAPPGPHRPGPGGSGQRRPLQTAPSTTSSMRRGAPLAKASSTAGPTSSGAVTRRPSTPNPRATDT